MTIQLSTTVINNMLDSFETTVGTAPLLIIYSGAKPTNPASADPSGVLATITLPSDWMANASGGSKALSGSWAGSASAAGTAASYRIKNSAGTVCHAQGTVTATGGGGDMTLDNAVLASGQAISVTSFNLSDTVNA